jgi:CubicO group peptidase (beta-lactamase class C family)
MMRFLILVAFVFVNLSPDVQAAGTARDRAMALIKAELVFKPSVFSGEEFPSCGFLTPGLIREQIGDYTFDVTFYDRKYLFDPLGCESIESVDASAMTWSNAYDLACIGQLLANRGSYGNRRFFSEETFEKMLPRKLDHLLGPDTEVTWGTGLTWFRGNGLSDRTIGHGSASSCTLRVDLENDLVITMTRATAGSNFGKYHRRFIKAVTGGIQR